MVNGSPATYQIAVTNVGTSPMPGPITVTDTLSTALTYTAATGTGWTCSAVAQTVTCTTPGPLAVSAALPPITLTVMVGGAGAVVPASVDNCASVAGGAGATGAPADVNPQNDRSCTVSQVVKAGTLCIVKFNDLNGNGVQDPGEPVLANWTFTVTKPDGTTATVTTNADGRICRDVPPGSYTIAEVAQAGWTQTAPVPVGTQTVTVASGQTTTVVFGNHATETKPGTLCVVKFNDLNGNGKQDPGEPILFGWVFTIKDANGVVVGTVTTSAAVAQTCIDLPPGTYTVTETQQAGWTPTVPAGGSQTVTIVSGQTTTITFGNHATETKPGTLCVVKFNDLNGNGKQDPGEPTLGGWVFTITDATNTVVGTITTTATEPRTCKDLPPGTYTVTETPQPGWVQTAPTPVGPQTVTVVSGQVTTVIFGNHQNACCLTFVFQHGKKDDFSLANGATAEPVVPAPAPPTTTQLYFDGTDVNRQFSDRLVLPTGNCISAATFSIRMKPLKDVPKNDTIVLKIPGTGGTTWSKSINPLSTTSSPSYPWITGKAAKTFTWNLGAMPLGGANLLPALNTLRVLDVYVQDDTSVDYITLTVTFCPCQQTTPPTGVIAPAAAPVAPATAPVVAPCDCLPAAPRP
jgi:uncharacterized repeat protein (TIGR01451 family)